MVRWFDGETVRSSGRDEGGADGRGSRSQDTWIRKLQITMYHRHLVMHVSLVHCHRAVPS